MFRLIDMSWVCPLHLPFARCGLSIRRLIVDGYFTSPMTTMLALDREHNDLLYRKL